MRKVLLLGLSLCMVMFETWAQDRTVSGKVTSAEDGSSLPGVNVLVKGGTNGSVTDVDGNYKLSAPEGSTLVFTFIGMVTQEVEVGSRSVIDVQLVSDVQQLSEVVVTAMGIERQERALGYSISTVKSDELTVARDPNIINSLQGKVSGIQITQQSGNLGGSSKILIRGVSSLTGNNNPLWVVDGVQIFDTNIITGSRISGGYDVGNRAQDINPDDIESISVLKGASAAALYGSRAANGVIIVTTKKGQNRGAKLSIQVNSSMRFDNPLVLPDFQNEYGPGNLGKYDVVNGSAGWGPKINGQSVEDFTGETVDLKAFPNNTKDFYRTGKTLINNVAVGGGSSDGSGDYRLSLTSLNQTGILPAAELDRYTISLNAGQKLSNNFNSRFGVQYIKTTSSGRAAAGANDPNVLTNIINFWPRTTDISKLETWINEDGTQNNPLDNFTNNPYWIAHENKFDTDVSRMIGHIELGFTPTDWLNFKGRASMDNVNDKRFRSNRKGTIGREPGDFTDDLIRQNQITIDFLANGNKNITEDLNLNVILGYQLNERKFDRLLNDASNLTVAELFSTGNAEVNNPVKDYSLVRTIGGFYDITLSYKDWLTLNTTGRNDWTSTLDNNNNSYFYPSVNLSFIFTDGFNISNNILSYGKLRASWANVGNGAAPYALDFNYSPQTTAFGQFGTSTNFPFGGVLSFSGPGVLPPLALVPENQLTYEVGTELQFFKGRIGLDVTYYNIRQEDQIINVPVPESTGYSLFTTNVGTTSNKGIELELGADIIKAGSFSWNMLYTFTKNNFEVVELTEGVDRLVVNSGFNSTQIIAEPGKGYGLYGNAFAKDTLTNQVLIDPLTGLRFQGDNERFGDIYPEFLMGLTNNVTYKGFSLRFTFDWRQGGVIFSNTVAGLRRSGLAEETLENREGTFIDNGGVILNEDGTNRPNDVPVANVETFWGRYASASIAEGNIFDASFVKLREIGLNYALPKSLLDKTPFGSAQIGVESRNVAILYRKVPHIDPETNLFGSANDGAGVERGSVPSTRSIGFNVRLTF